MYRFEVTALAGRISPNVKTGGEHSVPEMLPKQNCPDPYVKTRAPPEQNWDVIMSHEHSGVRLNPTTNLQRSALKHGYQVATKN